MQFMMKLSFSLISWTAVLYFSSRVSRALLAVCNSFDLSLNCTSSLLSLTRSSALALSYKVFSQFFKDQLFILSVFSESFKFCNSSPFSSSLTFSSLFSYSWDFNASSKEARFSLVFSWSIYEFSRSMMMLAFFCFYSYSTREMVGSRIIDLDFASLRVEVPLDISSRNYSFAFSRDFIYRANPYFYCCDFCNQASVFANFSFNSFTSFSKSATFSPSGFTLLLIRLQNSRLLGLTSGMIFPLSSRPCMKESIFSRLEGGEGSDCLGSSEGGFEVGWEVVEGQKIRSLLAYLRLGNWLALVLVRICGGT